MSTQVASSRPSTLRGPSSSATFSASSISSTIVRTWRVFVALDEHERLGDRDDVADVEHDDLVALLVGGGVSGDPGSAVSASETGATGVKRRSLRDVISRQCRGRGAWMARTTAGGTRPSTGRPSREPLAQVGRRRCRGAGSPPARPATRRRAARRARRRPLDDHDRGEVAGLVEPPPGAHVGDRVGAEHEEQLAVRAR